MDDQESTTQHRGHSLSREFVELANLCSGEHITLAAIVAKLQARGPALVTFVLATPFLLPVPMPGVSVPFGLVMMIFSAGLILGRNITVPVRFQQKVLPASMVRKVALRVSLILIKVETFFKPRWLWWSENRLWQMFAALIMMGAAAALALPLPPGTNAPPASVLVFLSIGLLERDGVACLLGLVLAVLNIVFFGMLFYFGYEALIDILHLGYIKSL